MAVAVVQRAHGQAIGANAVAFGAAATVGNTIIVATYYDGFLAEPSIADNLGNTYTLDGSGVTLSAGSGDKFYLWRLSNLANAPTTITVTSNARFNRTEIYEVSGLTNTTPLDVFTIGTAGAAAAVAFAFTTAAPGEFAGGILSTNSGGVAKVFTPGSAGIVWNGDYVASDLVWNESFAPTGAAAGYVLDGSIPSLNGPWDYMIFSYKAPGGTSGIKGRAWLKYLLMAGALGGGPPSVVTGGLVDVPGPAGSLSLSLTWSTPLFNADGSAISPAVTNQRIVYDTVSRGPLGGYAYVKYIGDGTTRAATISSLAAGTYYCSMQTYNGQWSELEPEFVKASA